jgi:hypothetical protein
LAKKVDAAGVTAPKPVADLKASTNKYSVVFAMGPQEMKMSLTTTIKEENGAWSVSDAMQTPMGTGTDAAILEKGTLLTRSRKVQQGPMSMEVAFADGKATGVAKMGAEKPISADTGGPLFADGPGMAHAIGALPLAEGYSAVYRNFDTDKMKVKLMQLKVAATEPVTVPAGKFDAFRVEIASAEGGPEKTTIWIAKDTRLPVKLVSVIAAMGGATMTAELQP